MPKRRAVPARLSRLEQRFAAWREKRVKGERIPPSLWKSAAKLALDYGVSQTSTVLKLDYYSLKKRVGEQPSTPATFVELPSPPITFANECLIELEDGMGASMRLQLKGADLSGVLALGRSFWGVE